MLDATDTDQAPWHIVQGNDKRRARLNCMRFVLNSIPYDDKDKKVVCAPDPEIVGSVKDMYKFT